MTMHEIALVGTILGTLLVGALVKQYRNAHRALPAPPSSMATPKLKAATPPYVRMR
jgi:hypothetical protein